MTIKNENLNMHPKELEIEEIKKLIQLKNYSSAEKKIKLLMLKFPKSFILKNLFGVSLLSQNKINDAIKNYLELIEIKPDFPEAYNNLATIYMKLNKIEEAISNFNKALKSNPNLIEANLNLAKIYMMQKTYNKAENSLKKISQIKSISAKTYFDIATIYEEMGNLEKTIENYNYAIKRKKNFAEAYNNLAKVLLEVGKIEESIKNCKEAIKYKSNFAVAYYNLGKAYRDLGEFDEAVKSNQKAIEIDPGFAEACNNLGNAFKELGEFNKASKCFDKALKIKPDYLEAHYNESYLKLLMGDFDTGWKKYEYRWLVKDNFKMKHQNIPLWLGDKQISNKSILVWAEQGLGDCIHFCRYVLNLLEMSADVTIEVPSSLKKITETISKKIKVIENGEKITNFDYQIPVMSLPLAFKTNLNNIPKKIPYLNVSDDLVEKWSKKLGPKKKLRIGLTWSGNPKYKRDKIRSMRLKKFEPILSENYEFFCLQKEVQNEDLFYLNSSKIKNFGNEDFLNTAAIIKNLDLVISTCTSIAHLSGAIGAPTWLLLGYIADWRWLTNRNDTPWYPTVKIFKQTHSGEWDDVIKNVKQRLQAL